MPLPINPNADIAAFDVGLAVAEAPDDIDQRVASVQEKAYVAAWFERIDTARQHDEDAYKQLAIDRAYARGDSSYRVKVNVIGAYIDTWGSLLYARNPDVDALPADQAGDDDVTDARQFGETAMIVISKQWRKARLKQQAQSWVRAALTSKVGWLKCSWQERDGYDPTTARAIADIQDNLALVEKMAKELTDDPVGLAENDRKQEELRLAIQGLQSKTEAKVIRGIAIDPVDMADITLSDECPSVTRYLESPWMCHRMYMRIDEAKARFTRLTKDDWSKASMFAQKKPKAMAGKVSANDPTCEINASDADSYSSYISNEIKSTGKGQFVCVEEIWDRDTQNVITLIRGVDRYACPPEPPNVGTSRFYPFFGLCFTDVDGQRWAQSLNERSQTLQDAYDRAYAAFETARSRVKPKMIFNASLMNDGQLKKILAADEQELIPIEFTNPKQDIRQLLFPVQYGQIDPALYDTRIIMEKFELIWGLQEALSGTIDVAKTATEAELQQGGTMARTSNKRDILEDQLTELAQYIFEIDVQKLEHEEVVKLAGKQALWPTGLTPDDFDTLTVIQVRAGSSGKPNTKAQREAWAQLLPLLEGLSGKIAQLRSTSPIDYSNVLEELITETVARAGENIDTQRFIPPLGQPIMLPVGPVDPATGQPAMMAFYPAPMPTEGGAPPVAGGTPPPSPPAMDTPAPESAPV